MRKETSYGQRKYRYCTLPFNLCHTNSGYLAEEYKVTLRFGLHAHYKIDICDFELLIGLHVYLLQLQIQHSDTN
jgi:hypothetical protein